MKPGSFLAAGACVIAALTIAGLALKHKRDRDLSEIMAAYRAKIYSGYEYEINPTESNNKKYAARWFQYSRLLEDKGITSINRYLTRRGVYFFWYDSDLLKTPAKTYYAAKVIEEREIDGVNVLLTDSDAKDLPGIKTLEYRLYKIEFSKTIKYASGDGLIVIDVAPIRAQGERWQRKWDEYIRNNEARDSPEGDSWSPEKQAVYNALGGVKKSRIADEYTRISIDNSIHHERFHVLDDKHDNPEDREMRAYAYALTKSPLSLTDLEYLAVMENPQGPNAMYHEVALKVIGGLMAPDITDKKALYRLSNEELSKRAQKFLDEIR